VYWYRTFPQFRSLIEKISN